MICRGGMLVCWLAGWLVAWLVQCDPAKTNRPQLHPGQPLAQPHQWSPLRSSAVAPNGKATVTGESSRENVLRPSRRSKFCCFRIIPMNQVLTWTDVRAVCVCVKKKYNYIYMCVCISALLFELLYLVFHRFHRIVSFFIALSIYLSIHPSKSPMYLFLCKSVLFTTPTVPTSSHLILAELPPVSSWNGRCKPPQRPQHVAPHRIWFSTGRRLGHPPLTRRFSPFWLGAIVL